MPSLIACAALLALVVLSLIPPGFTINAGASKIDFSPPLGAPLAGYNHGPRRAPYWPMPYPDKYTTFMMPNVGIIDNNWARALVIEEGKTMICFVTTDAIGSDGPLNRMAYDIAASKGFNVPFENVIFSASHSHSGQGGVSSSFFWNIAPATDLLSPELQRLAATRMAKAMLDAQANLRPAAMNIGMSQLIGVTRNRRANISPYVSVGTIDPNLGVMRVDSLSGEPIATLWNFAIHGTCYGADNMKVSSDIMGYSNILVEKNVGGVSLFINADAGDIAPADQMCSSAPSFKGGAIMADKIMAVRKQLVPQSSVSISAYSFEYPMGPTALNLTLERVSNCTSGGWLDICTFCKSFGCVENLRLYDFSNWIENTPIISAFGFLINGVSTVIGSMPGEPLVEMGWWLRNDTLKLGFNNTFIAGYSNSHLGYFATPREYEVGGYEGLLTMWGIDTTVVLRKGFNMAIEQIKRLMMSQA